MPCPRPPEGAPRPIILLGDLHAPEHDRRAWKALRDFIRDAKPSHIVATELCEFGSLSLHGGVRGTWGNELECDFAAGRHVLKELREAAPDDASITLLEANHDTRLTRFLEQHAPQLSSSLSVPIGLQLERFGVTWVPEDKQPLVLGKLRVLHGHQIARLLPKHHAMRAAELYGAPGITTVYFHTHKHQVFERPCYGGSTRAVGLGCLRSLKPGWLHGQEAGWVHQFGVAWDDNLYAVTITRGSFVWAGKRYG